ncbi:hypothetical protein OC844_003503 [Tilletia horrida]|nr:hypothetical protein OC844_003503 [Tilletia horrida]
MGSHSQPPQDEAGDAVVGFALNPRLVVDTPAPPVAIAAGWAATFPLPASPFLAASHRPSRGDVVDRIGMLNLAQGVPGQPPSAGLLRRIEREGRSDLMLANGYTSVFGVEVLRTAIAADVTARYELDHRPPEPGQGVPLDADHVAVTAGANLAFAIVAQALAQHGDSVLLPTPWYFNHHMTLASLGICSKPVPTRAGLPSPRDIRTLLQSDQSVKAVVVVSPNNPCGTTCPAALLDDIFDVCADASVALILDETYRDFVVNAEGTALARPHDLFSRPGWQKTLIHISSFSKSYAIPGHRLGYILSHPSLLLTRVPDRPAQYGPIAKALDNYQICPPRADTQRAVAWAIADEQEKAWRKDVALALHERRTIFARGLETPVAVGDDQAATAAAAVSPQDLGWELESMGAYYAFVKTPFQDASGEEVARALAGLVGVIVLPGSFFMPEGSTDPSAHRIRISVANVSAERLKELPSRLVMLTQLWKDSGNRFPL